MPRPGEWKSNVEIAWCPGCGNYRILNVVAAALSRLDLKPEQVVFVSGIGQAGKLPHYLRCNFLHCLHGRALACALGVKLANPELTVIAVGGDGDMYGEGGNHLLHALRRNPDITCLVHNNGVYGLTRGQPAPTGAQGVVSRLTPAGTRAVPFNPVAMGVAAQGTFVARGFAGAEQQLVGLITEAVRHKGFGFVDVLQPCVTFDPARGFEWYADRVYELTKESHDEGSPDKALRRALEWPARGAERIPTGVFLRTRRPVYESGFPVLKRGGLTDLLVETDRVMKAAGEFR